MRSVQGFAEQLLHLPPQSLSSYLQFVGRLHQCWLPDNIIVHVQSPFDALKLAAKLLDAAGDPVFRRTLASARELQENKIFKRLFLKFKVPKTRGEWEQVMGQSEKRWHFHNCCGAMDGKHVNIRYPPNSGSVFFNYKKTFSVILFAVVDANLNFLYVDVGTNGRVNDAQVFSKSAFYQALERNQLNVHERGVSIGDDAFLLREDLFVEIKCTGMICLQSKRSP